MGDSQHGNDFDEQARYEAVRRGYGQLLESSLQFRNDVAKILDIGVSGSTDYGGVEIIVSPVPPDEDLLAEIRRLKSLEQGKE